MKNKRKSGFSLTEILFAVGILAVGMIFIAGVFPVAIRFVTIAAERSIAAVAADEAFAKIKLYGVNPTKLWADKLTPAPTFLTDPNIDPNEFFYPSTPVRYSEKQYYWTALCRLAGSSEAQVTVFVCRRVGTAVGPLPYSVGVSQASKPDEISINIAAEKMFINDGYTIVDDATGYIYRVLERYPDNPATPVFEDQIIRLDRYWLGGATGTIWVVPPTVGGRYPCVAVYQKVIRF